MGIEESQKFKYSLKMLPTSQQASPLQASSQSIILILDLRREAGPDATRQLFHFKSPWIKVSVSHSSLISSSRLLSSSNFWMILTNSILALLELRYIHLSGW